MAKAKPKPKPKEPDKPKLSLEELAAQYGYAAAFFNSSPELAGLIQQAVAGQWTPDKFRAALMASQWYRSFTESSRAWVELNARDPVEVQKRIQDKGRQIQQMANQQGISISQSRLAQMAEWSLAYGWDDTLLQQSVAAEWQYRPGDTAGAAATLEVRVKQLADEYGVTVTDPQIADFVSGSMAGRYTEDHIADFMRDQARSKYVGLRGYLDLGMTVKQAAGPYLNSYASILEVSPETVSVTDPYIQRALQGSPPQGGSGGDGGVNPPASSGGLNPRDTTALGGRMVGGRPAAGKPPVVPQSLYDFERDLRKDPRWLKTKNARESIQNGALGILRDFGIYG